MGWGGGAGPLGIGGGRMLHIMLCIMLHVLDLLLRCRDKDFGLINFLPDKKTSKNPYENVYLDFGDQFFRIHQKSFSPEI